MSNGPDSGRIVRPVELSVFDEVAELVRAMAPEIAFEIASRLVDYVSVIEPARK